MTTQLNVKIKIQYWFPNVSAPLLRSDVNDFLLKFQFFVKEFDKNVFIFSASGCEILEHPPHVVVEQPNGIITQKFIVYVTR